MTKTFDPKQFRILDGWVSGEIITIPYEPQFVEVEVTITPEREQQARALREELMLFGRSPASAMYGWHTPSTLPPPPDEPKNPGTPLPVGTKVQSKWGSKGRVVAVNSRGRMQVQYEGHRDPTWEWREDVLTNAELQAPASGEWPHRCPRCSAPAYVGFSSVDCSKRCGP